MVSNGAWSVHARGVRVRVYTLRPLRSNYQPDHEPLIPLTEFVGSPVDPRAWGSLLAWLVRRPHVLIPEVARILWASRASLYARAQGLPSRSAVKRKPSRPSSVSSDREYHRLSRHTAR